MVHNSTCINQCDGLSLPHTLILIKSIVSNEFENNRCSFSWKACFDDPSL
jgi:hypothetical protein